MRTRSPSHSNSALFRCRRVSSVEIEKCVPAISFEGASTVERCSGSRRVGLRQRGNSSPGHRRAAVKRRAEPDRADGHGLRARDVRMRSDRPASSSRARTGRARRPPPSRRSRPSPGSCLLTATIQIGGGELQLGRRPRPRARRCPSTGMVLFLSATPWQRPRTRSRSFLATTTCIAPVVLAGTGRGRQGRSDRVKPRVSKPAAGPVPGRTLSDYLSL